MKSILLHINDDKGLEARTQAALDLARAFDGEVTCLQAVSFETFAPGDFYGSAMAAAMPVIKEAAEELRATMESDLANEDVRWNWKFEYGMAEHRLLEHSSLADVVVLGPHNIGEDRPRPSRLVGDLVMRARSPLLVVPEDHPRLDCNGHVLVAWNGSAEACIALRAALPLLTRADAVTLVSVIEAKDRDGFDVPPTNGAQYLALYGVEAELMELPCTDEGIAASLFSAARTRKASLLVMGAYGHSRLAEMLLGGVTRRALTDPQIPILLAH